MEGERKVILSALTSVGYIGYYIVSVYKVYVHGARVQRLRFHWRGKFFINGLRTTVCTCARAGWTTRVAHGHATRADRGYWFYRKLLPMKTGFERDAPCTASVIFESLQTIFKFTFERETREPERFVGVHLPVAPADFLQTEIVRSMVLFHEFWKYLIIYLFISCGVSSHDCRNHKTTNF